MRRLLSVASLLFSFASPLAAHEADQYLVLICGADVKSCQNEQNAFRKLYERAYKNDLASQRRLAQTLWKGSTMVPVDWQAGCAWHMTIVALAPKGLTEMDRQNMRTSCSLLREDQIALAKNQARDIGHRILSGGKIDTSIPKPPSPDLDSTAKPLFE